MKKMVSYLCLMLSSSLFAKTYVVPSSQIGCDKTLEVTSDGRLSHYEKFLKARLVGERHEKLFELDNINQFYDSVWLEYFSKNGEKLEYFWDDGYGINEGFRFRGCIYELP